MVEFKDRAAELITLQNQLKLLRRNKHIIRKEIYDTKQKIIELGGQVDDEPDERIIPEP